MKNELRKTVELLNKYRSFYYDRNTSLVTDKEYDDLYDRLVKLEAETGIIYPDSPTQTVGYTLQSSLRKVEHSHSMLSLDKTKSIEDVRKFALNPCVAMWKLDGLSLTLTYQDGNLIKAETRGNGTIGEDVLENAKCISNIPLHINQSGEYTIDGEVIMTYSNFDSVNKSLENKYSHPRNLASGSLRQLDTSITASRNLTFIAWRIITYDSSKSFIENINDAKDLGFTTVDCYLFNSFSDIEGIFACLKNSAKEAEYPIDGIVITYNDIEYGISLGDTSHHPRHSLAYKFYDDVYETVLRDIEWSTSRTGRVNPVAVFDEVIVDGVSITRASLHNVSIMEELELGIGDTITIYRANSVIPKVDDNLTRSNTYVIPTNCPSCNAALTLKNENGVKTLYCTNNTCNAIILDKFVNFVSKNGVNIDGLSEKTISRFLQEGFINTFSDLYELERYKDKIINLDGFGSERYNNLITAIQRSRNIKLENYIAALGIEGVGLTVAKKLAEWVNGDYDLFCYNIMNQVEINVNGIGNSVWQSLQNWFKTGIKIEGKDLQNNFNFIPYTKPSNNGKVYCITGKLTNPRSYYEMKIKESGGSVVSSVTKNVDYLVCNEPSSSSKYKKAVELGIKIIDENTLISLL